MKKSFINDIKTFIVEVLLTCFFVFVFIGCLIGGHETPGFCTIFIFLSVFLLCLSTEIIVMEDDKIISKKFWRQKKILYIDIVCIENGIDIGAHASGMETGWRITDFRNQSIFLVEMKKRKTDIAFIEQRANQRLQ